ncbi:MAG TPA: ErpA-related iron-sulfur cluster insertion protein [Desulfovibrio sp.]|uniref:ErpA-related iron-sulfur cluster insertion protein n=1 Tax=Desulfovibrio TaxID=872 RepID=UPI000426E5C9|nr:MULTISPECIES: ErpA-related iron-sulfur cluster insertion protein [Desulfovibrio]HMM38213.1 ErpA-related iron-sulfur cluster insertion protein [Desulfovibrio sp.]
MFSVETTEEILKKLRNMLSDEEEDACVRLREYKAGCGCHSKIMLGLGLEEAVEGEDERIDVDGVPFIAEKDFLLKHGKSYMLTLDENKQTVLTALQPPA